MQAPRADLSEPSYSCCDYPPLGGSRSPWSSFDASIGAAMRPVAGPADRFQADTRFDPRSKPAAAASAKRATSRPGRAAASRGRPPAQSDRPHAKRAGA
jgi:hypothetical protein